MSARSSLVPKYCLHKPSRRAYVRIHGKVVYVGEYGSADSKREYGRLIAELAVNPLPRPKNYGEITITEVCAAYWDFAQGYYSKNGKPTRTLDQVKQGIRAVKNLYGHQPAATFGPQNLLTIQGSLAAGGSTRSYVNKLVGEIKRIFKWGVSRELVPPIVQTALSTVEGLRMGRSAARESKPVLPVDDAVIEATLLHMPVVVAAMVRFQRLTGARPGEVCMLRPCDVDHNGEVWTYRPESHKTEHHGRERTIYIGPKAQAVLLPYLLRDAQANCFSPTDSERRRLEKMRARRKTPVQPSQQDRRKPRPSRKPGKQYFRNSYAQAIRRAIQKANQERLLGVQEANVDDPALLPHWHPNQLRHSAATEIRRKYGLEAAQVILGHSKADVTQIYAERDTALAVEVARKIG